MEHNLKINPPNSEAEKKEFHETYDALTEVIKNLTHDSTRVIVKETKQEIELPASAIKLLQAIMKHLANGLPVSIVPEATEVTTQKAAEILGVSRPFVVKLVDRGDLPHKKVGRHRRLKFKDVIEYKKKMINQRKKALEEMVALGQKYGLYDQ